MIPSSNLLAGVAGRRPIIPSYQVPAFFKNQALLSIMTECFMVYWWIAMRSSYRTKTWNLQKKLARMCSSKAGRLGLLRPSPRQDKNQIQTARRIHEFSFLEARTCKVWPNSAQVLVISLTPYLAYV